MKDVASKTIAPWLRQENLPPTLSVKPHANSSNKSVYNHCRAQEETPQWVKRTFGHGWDSHACKCKDTQAGGPEWETHHRSHTASDALLHWFSATSHMKPRWFPEWGRRVCCLHKQCHISVNIICHPDILDRIQFPLGFAQLGTWLLQHTANSIRANACLRQICLRQTLIFARWSLLHLAWREDFQCSVNQPLLPASA